MMQYEDYGNQLIHSLIEMCESDGILSLEIIKKLDELTQYSWGSSNNELITICQQTWLMVQKSSRFWENAHLIISNSVHQQTILQILVKVHERIKVNWTYQNPQIRSFYKTLMCNFAKQYPSMCQSNNQKYKTQFRKINAIIVQILKYQWNSDWKEFLFQICTAMLQDQNMAENYLDLIKVTFEEIFNQDDLLTSHQMKDFSNNINNNSAILFQTFQTFLNSQHPQARTKNCLLALEAMIPVLNLSSIYLNLSFQKIINLIKNPNLELIVLNCLFALFRIKCEKQIEKVIKIKLLEKKKQILIQLLNQLNPEANQIMKRKMIDIAALVIEDLEKQTPEELNSKNKFECSQIIQRNIFICSKITEIIGNQSLELSDIKIYKFMVKHARFYNHKPLVLKFINLTECPFNSSYFKEQKVFVDTLDQNKEKNQERKQLQLIFKDLIKINEKQYQEILFDQLEKEPKNIIQLQHFCRICWNYYIFLKQTNFVGQNILLFTNRICSMEQEIDKIFMINQKFSSFNTKVLACCRANILLILSHQKSMKIKNFREAFLFFTAKTFTESTILAKFCLKVLKEQGKQIKLDQIRELFQKHCKAVNNRKDRVNLEQLFIDFICSWVQIKLGDSSGNMRKQQGHELIMKIINIYRTTFKDLRAKKTQAKIQLNGLKCHILEISYKLLTLFKIILSYDHEIENITDEMFEELMLLLMSRKTCEDIKQINEIKLFQIKCTQVQKILLINLLPRLFNSSKLQISNKLFQLIMDNINEQLNMVGKISLQKSDSENQQLDQVLDLVSYFIMAMQKCEGNITDKKSVISVILSIVNRVNDICFDSLSYAHLEFISTIVKSKYIKTLPHETISRMLYQIFDFVQTQQQKYIQGAHDVLSNLLMDAIQSTKNNVQTQIQKIIINLTCNLFKIIIRPNFPKYFLNDYCQLLNLCLQTISSRQYKFHQTQYNGNEHQIFIQLSDIIKKQYHYLRNDFISEVISIRLKNIIYQHNDFCEDFRNFLVELKRGFFAQKQFE